MNCLADKTTRRYQTTAKSRIIIFIIFLIFLIFQSTNAQEQWRVFTTQNSQLPANTIGSIVVDRNNVKWIGTAEGMVKIDGNNWTIYDTTNTPLVTNYIYPKTVDEFNNLWISVYGYGIAKFDGLNWTIYDTTNSGIPSVYITSIAIDPLDVKWIGTYYGLGKFDGTNWTIYRTTNSGLPANSVSTIAIEGHTKWIGTDGLYGGMAKFNDTNWVIYNTANSGIPNNTIHDIKVDNWGIKWIGTHFGGGVGRYNSISNSWIVYNTQNSGLPDGYVSCVLTQEHIKWFGTEGGGLARFNDTGWQVFNTYNSPLPSYTINCISIDSLTNIWIGTYNGIAIYNENGIVGNILTTITIPTGYHLYPCYPNPFNPSTTIEFDIPKTAHINLSIFDISGKKMVELVNNVLRQGTYSVKWNAINYSSGIYFYTLSSNKIRVTNKMVLLK